jgi:hypothetical protein
LKRSCLDVRINAPLKIKNMAQKMENIQYPVGEGSKKSNEEFLKEVQDLYDPMEDYLDLKDDYFRKMEILDVAKKEIALGLKEGNLSYHDKKTLNNLIKKLSQELEEISALAKDIARKNSEIVTDPRYSLIRFENMHGNPDKSDG